MAVEARRRVTHRDALLHHGMKLFYARGFHATSVDDVLASANVPKGSFYHHFGSKDAFGLAVLDRYAADQISLLDRWLSRTDLSTTDKISGHFQEMAQLFVKSGYAQACLAGKFSAEIATSSEGYRRTLSEHFLSWKAQYVAVLCHGSQVGDVRTDRTPAQIADAVVAIVQGAFIVAISTRDETSLKSIAAVIPTIVLGD